MAARAVVPASAFVKDGSLLDPAGTAVDATNGNTVASPGPWKVILRITNTAGTGYNAIIRASGNGVTAAGAAQTSPAPSNVVYAQSTIGDLTVPVAATTGVRWIGPLGSDRFAQADGSLSIDYSNTSFAGTVTAFVLPGTTGMAAAGLAAGDRVYREPGLRREPGPSGGICRPSRNRVRRAGAGAAGAGTGATRGATRRNAGGPVSEVTWLRGSGGALMSFAGDLPPFIAAQVAKGDLTRVALPDPPEGCRCRRLSASAAPRRGRRPAETSGGRHEGRLGSVGRQPGHVGEQGAQDAEGAAGPAVRGPARGRVGGARGGDHARRRAVRCPAGRLDHPAAGVRDVRRVEPGRSRLERDDRDHRSADRPAAVGTPVPATSAGITALDMAGLNQYVWAVDPAQAPGDYLVTWSGTVGSLTLTYVQTVTVAAMQSGAPAPGVYATVAAVPGVVL